MTTTDIPLLRKCMELAKILDIYLKEFPKEEKFATCTQIRNTLTNMLRYYIEATEELHYKKTALKKLDMENKVLKAFLLFAKEREFFGNTSLGYNPELNTKRYMVTTRITSEIGKMIGAWVKHAK